VAREPGIEAQVRGLGKPLRPTRKETDLSRSTLAARAGPDLAAVSLLERAMRAPTLGALVHLARAVDATTSLLLAGGSARPIRQPAVEGLAGGLRYACRETPRPTPRAAELLHAAAPGGGGGAAPITPGARGVLKRFGANPREGRHVLSDTHLGDRRGTQRHAGW
jgi:transcriptional regulator with XRE-family HTH domain